MKPVLYMKPLQNMKSLEQQRGLTAIAIILMLLVLAFFVAIVLTMFPIYMEHFAVNSHLQSLKDESKISTMTDLDITKSMERKFDIDNITHVNKDDIDIEPNDKGGRTVSIDYEVRDHFLANVDVVVSFHNEVDVPGKGSGS